MGVKKTTTNKKMGRKPKFDYTSKEFLSRIFELAKKGYTDREIARTVGMNETYFYEKKSELSEISDTLKDARAQINTIVRNAFLKSALGGRIVRSYRYVQKRCECKGKDPDCEICDGTGWITPKQHREVSESELPPNPLVQERWLHNYDPDYRKRQKSLDDDVDYVPQENDIKKGVNISDWINKELTTGAEDD